MLMEEEAIKEMILYIYKNKSKFGVFQVFNEMEALDLDDALINEYLTDLCEGKVNESLIDYVEDLYEEIEDVKQVKNRRNLLSLIGDRDVYFDCDEDEWA